MAYASYYKPALHGTLSPATDTGFLKSSQGFLKLLLENFRNWRLRVETRRQLRNLPDYLLNDIGITRYEIDNTRFRF